MAKKKPDPNLVYPNGFTLAQIESCTSRGKQAGKKGGGGCACSAKPIYQCALYGKCTITKVANGQTEHVCVTCTECTPVAPPTPTEPPSDDPGLPGPNP